MVSDRHKELVLKRVRDVPSLPEVVNQIIRLLGQSQTAASEIARLISYDPGLSSRVLRMVNSAAYGIQRQISSIQHSIMILGFNTVRGLVLSASIFKLFDKGAHSKLFDQTAYWRHSLLTAMLARHIGELYELPVADEVFSAGLLHDIGKLILQQYFTADYQKVLKQFIQLEMTPHGLQNLRLEHELMGLTHTEIGAYLGTKWKLPVSIIEAIQHHHAPSQAKLHPELVYCVAFANTVAAGVEQSQSFETIFSKLHPDVRRYFELENAAALNSLAACIESSLQELDNLMESFTEAAVTEGDASSASQQTTRPAAGVS